MMPLRSTEFTLEFGVRWLARLLAAFVVGIVLLFLVGTGGFNPFTLSSAEGLELAFFLTACLGMVTAWRWESIGGIIAIVGIALFIGTEFALKGGLPRGWMFYLMFLPGFLFILDSFLRRRVTRK
jgi:hypothetical protein